MAIQTRERENEVGSESSARAISRPVAMGKGKGRAGPEAEEEKEVKKFRAPMNDNERNWWSEHLVCLLRVLQYYQLIP